MELQRKRERETPPKAKMKKKTTLKGKGTGQLERIVCIVWDGESMTLGFAQFIFYNVRMALENMEQSENNLTLIILPEVLEELQKQCLMDGIVCKRIDLWELILFGIEAIRN